MNTLQLIFVLIIGVVIHDGGRFLIGRILGAKVEEYDLFFEPKLIRFDVGDTAYVIGALPFGGKTYFYGADFLDESQYKSPYAYLNLSIWKRFLIAIGGSISLLFITLLMLAVVFTRGFSVTTMKVDSVDIGSPAYQSGIHPGDEILALNENKVNKWQEFIQAVEFSGGKELNLEVKRNGQILTFVISPQGSTETPRLEQKSNFILGLMPYTFTEKHNLNTALELSLREIWQMFSDLLLLPMRLIISSTPTVNIYLSPVSRLGGNYAIVVLSCTLFVSLAFFNLFPFRGLCGEEVLFLLLEVFLRKPVDISQRAVFSAIAMFIFTLLIVSINIVVAILNTTN